jgi:anti-anti-sigma regulatory factor
VCGDASIIRVFEITGLDRVFSIYPTRVEAVEQFHVSGAPA